MSRLQQILIAVLLVQIGVLAFLFIPRNVSDQSEKKLLADVDFEQVVSLEITDHDGKYIHMAKDGDTWNLPDAGDYPVLSDNIDNLVEKLESIQTDKLITKTSASHKRLQVSADDFQRKVVISLKDGSAETLYIGTTAGSQTVHVRLDGDDEVYLARNLSAYNFNPEASSWIDATYLSIDSSTITGAKLVNDAGTFNFEKSDGKWQMDGLNSDEEFNEPNLVSLFNRVSTMNMKTPLGKEEKTGYGLSSPQAVFTVTVKPEDGDEEVYTLTIGNDTEDGDACYVHASSSEYYVAVSKTVLQDFLNRSRADFIVQEDDATGTP